MQYIQKFAESLRSIGSPVGNQIDYERWRAETVPHEDEYMNGLFSFYLSSFIKGFYEVISPFTGEWVKSSFTILSRGGGHEDEARGNTGIFTMWGYIDSDDNIFLVGSMDVFGWITHLIVPDN